LLRQPAALSEAVLALSLLTPESRLPEGNTENYETMSCLLKAADMKGLQVIPTAKSEEFAQQ
jgi:hypothetical protein